MQKLTTLSLAMDNAQIEKSHRLIDSLVKKVKAYNLEVERSNKLLREQEKLRKNLNVKIKDGKTIGLVTKDK